MCVCVFVCSCVCPFVSHTKHKFVSFKYIIYIYNKPLADPGGTRALPRGPNFFIFMQFLAKNCKIIG